MDRHQLAIVALYGQILVVQADVQPGQSGHAQDC
jgi:hypothetical protein